MRGIGIIGDARPSLVTTVVIVRSVSQGVLGDVGVVIFSSLVYDWWGVLALIRPIHDQTITDNSNTQIIMTNTDTNTHT